jgi:hypothetical protein
MNTSCGDGILDGNERQIGGVHLIIFRLAVINMYSGLMGNGE